MPSRGHFCLRTWRRSSRKTVALATPAPQKACALPCPLLRRRKASLRSAWRTMPSPTDVLDAMESLLQKNPDDRDRAEILRLMRIADARDDMGHTLLYHLITNASKHHDTRSHSDLKHQYQIARLLILLRADINAKQGREDSGLTILHSCAYVGSVAAVNFCLDNGADLEALDGNGETPLMIGPVTKNRKSPNRRF